MIQGIDYAWGRPGPAAIKKRGCQFICRYLANQTSGKVLTRAEADLMSKNGIWLVVVWETTASRALAGHVAGIADAKVAKAKAKALGMPDDRPIYFAVDFDASSGQQKTINAYLDGCAVVLGRDRVGMYGGYWPIKRAFDANKMKWGWQTYAWSGGRWDLRAHIQQYKNEVRINGVDCDLDRAIKEDYGQWKVGVSPKEDDVTSDDIKKIVRAILDAGYNARGDKVREALQSSKDNTEKLLTRVAALEAKVAALEKETPS